MSVSKQNILNFPEKTNLSVVQIEAINWAELLHSGNAKKVDQVAFEAWLGKDQEHGETYRVVEQWWRDIDYVAATDAGLDQSIESYVVADERGERKSARASLWSMSIKTFAGIAAVLVMGFFLLQGGEVKDALPQERHVSAVGEVKTVELSDGTKVYLAGATTIITRFSGNERGAELVVGQAYFDVAPDKTRPFIVKAGNTLITVVGTEFDIQRSDDDVRVSVVEGRVEVAEESERAAPRHLTAGQQLFAWEEGGLGDVQSFRPETDISWKVGRLEYVNAPLSRVINEVNRYRKNKIILRNKKLEDYPITISLAFDETERLITGLKYAGVATIIQRAGSVVIEEK
ncbi:FecR family protein [Paremcibacter congregatus]|uniref:FecR family protein n=1 Tax=Paremcibacter congregatus TaxID=2043170 RepID=UPI003A8CEB22